MPWRIVDDGSNLDTANLIALGATGSCHFPGNAIWHPDDIEQITAVKHESDAEGEDADMQVEDPEFLLVDTADQVPESCQRLASPVVLARGH